jgi:hypothetical protein
MHLKLSQHFPAVTKDWESPQQKASPEPQHQHLQDPVVGCATTDQPDQVCSRHFGPGECDGLL